MNPHAPRHTPTPIASWSFDIFQYPGSAASGEYDPALAAQTYQRYLSRWEYAEARGFTGAFFSEHHYSGYNMSPSPNILVAALAARTKTLKLGVLSNVVPLHNPRRLAEEAAMLDVLSGGRLQVGLGPGGGPRDAILSGIPLDTLRDNYKKGARLIADALTDSVMDFATAAGAPHPIPVHMMPRPVQVPRPPIWITAMSRDSAEWAGENGYNLASTWLPTAEVRSLVEAWETAADRSGQPSEPTNAGLRRRVFVASSDAEAEDIVAAAPNSFLDQSFDEAGDHRPMVEKMMTNADDTIVGSVATVTERLIQQAREARVANLILWSDFRNFGADQLDRNHELLAQVNSTLAETNIS